MNLTVRGDATADLRLSDLDLVIASLTGPGAEAIHFVSVGMPQPVDLAGGTDHAKSRLRAGFDLIGWRGGGRYTIAPAGSLDTSSSPPGVRSGAFIEYWGLPLARNFVKYDRVVSACRLELDDDASKGSLECPLLEDTAGVRAISASLTWRRVGRSG